MIERVAYISIHTSPLEQPGRGDAGGMNVYIHELAMTMAARGVEVDVFTRRTSAEVASVVDVAPGYRVIHVEAGPPHKLPVAELPDLVSEFAEGIIKWAYAAQARYDIAHTHYWLSAWAGVLVKEALDIPLANSFHTLGRVKDVTRHPEEPSAGLLRIATENDVIARSDCVVASTPAEFDDLLEHYQADPGRLCVSPPGIDHGIFRPDGPAGPRRYLGDDPLLLFVGRIQPLKGVDVAIGALAELVQRIPSSRLVVVGGPSGPRGSEEMERVRRLVVEHGLEKSVHFVPAQPHEALPEYYRSADVLLVPSRSESFGLVAAEAQACGLPVVAAKVGGLAFAVADGESGFLVDGWDPAPYAAAAAKILENADLAASLAAGAIAFSSRFSWEATADRLLELYQGISGHDDG